MVEIFLTLKCSLSVHFIRGLDEPENNFPKLNAESDTVQSSITWILNHDQFDGELCLVSIQSALH